MEPKYFVRVYRVRLVKFSPLLSCSWEVKDADVEKGNKYAR